MIDRSSLSNTIIVLLVLALLLLVAAPAAGLALTNDNARPTPLYRYEWGVHSYPGQAPARGIA